MLPILKAEAPKFEAIKNDPSLSGMQKMKQLHAIHSESAPGAKPDPARCSVSKNAERTQQ